MSAAAYILAAVVAVLLIALVLCWMQPRRKQQTNSERAIAIMARDLAELPVRYMATGGALPPTTHLVGERPNPYPSMADQTFACTEHYYGPAGCPNCR